MKAVFFMSESMRHPELKDQTVYLFASESDAEEFIYDKLLDCGRAVSGNNRHDAICEAQSNFGMIEFFHVYDVESKLELAAR